jgi:hypothetical protein
LSELKFISSNARFAINGNEYTIDVVAGPIGRCIIKDVYADKVIFDGPAHGGPFSFENAEIIMSVIIEKEG